MLKYQGLIMKGKQWSNSCMRIKKCTRKDCVCFSDYYLWEKPEKTLDFEIWKHLILIEREII